MSWISAITTQESDDTHGVPGKLNIEKEISSYHNQSNRQVIYAYNYLSTTKSSYSTVQKTHQIHYAKRKQNINILYPD